MQIVLENKLYANEIDIGLYSIMCSIIHSETINDSDGQFARKTIQFYTI